MTPTTQSEGLPFGARLSSALAGEEITPTEYNGAQRVVDLEDSARKLFHKTTWSKVEVGDVALIAWPTGKRIDVAEVEITQLADGPAPDDEPLVVVFFRIDGLQYGQTFGPEDVAYVQSRL